MKLKINFILKSGKEKVRPVIATLSFGYKEYDVLKKKSIYKIVTYYTGVTFRKDEWDNENGRPYSDVKYGAQLQLKKKIEDVFLYLELDNDVKQSGGIKQQKNLKNVSRKMELTGINHYFTFLYQSEQITQNPCSFLKIRGIEKISLYKTFTAEQLTQLFDDYYTVFVKNYDYTRTPPNRLAETRLNKERNAVILNLLINQGTTTKEIDKMLLQDIDLIKATVKIRGGKRSNERNLQLKAEQIGLLINYIQNIRSQFLTATNQESEKLFFPYPNTGNQKSRNPESLMDLFKPLTGQVKEIDKNFLNFKQVRASVITHWLKVHGLRKTQYMAGHRYIRGTEYYLSNNLEDLTNDISKHHPF